MKYTNPLFILLLFCSICSCSIEIPTASSIGVPTASGYANKGGEQTGHSFPPRVEVQFEYSMGGPSFQPLSDGATLHSGQKYRIIVIPHQNCFIRVYQVDSTGKATVLKNANNRRVTAGTTVELPEKQMAYKLDNTVGSETIVFEASFDEFKGPSPNIVPIDDSSSQTVCKEKCVKSVTFQHMNQ